MTTFKVHTHTLQLHTQVSFFFAFDIFSISGFLPATSVPVFLISSFFLDQKKM